LPYADDALAPVISSGTIGYHYGKHHKGYYDTVLKTVKGSDLADATLEEIIRKTAAAPERVALFNASAQLWNHNFYWSSMRAKGGGKPGGALAEGIERDFGGYEAFRKEFLAAATGQFGSGWVWLVRGTDNRLAVVKTANADTPMAHGIACLLCCDIWEHAYYLDWQNRRADYVNAWLDRLVNWDFVARNPG